MGQSPMFSNIFDECDIAMTDMFIETSLLQYCDNNDDIYDDGIKMNEILLVLRIICFLLNKVKKMKVEVDMFPPLPSHHSQFP
jgi:hypothetical protein